MPLFFIFLILFCSEGLAIIKVGHVHYVKGILLSTDNNKETTILAKNDNLYLGEILSTGSTGFSVIKLKDGTKISLRPNTKFKLEDLSFKKNQEHAFLRLLKGGLRVVTGFISKIKKRPESFQISTPVANLGIRGTQFDVRICNDDCANDPNANLIKDKVTSKVIGRIIKQKGKVTAINEVGKTRHLDIGSALYQHDQLSTEKASYAVISFTDSSKITMAADSVVDILSHNFNVKKPKENHAALRLIRGGLRVLSGLISKLNRTEYTVSTLTATLGMRGTGFDLYCDGDCDTFRLEPKLEANECQFENTHAVLDMFKNDSLAPKKGLLMRVWDGAIDVSFDGCELLLEEGEVAVLKNENQSPKKVYDSGTLKPELDQAPRPDQVEAPDDLFSDPNTSSPSNETPKNGLYVSVQDGEVNLTGLDDSALDLGIGDSGYVSLNGQASRLSAVPNFLSQDQVPAPTSFTENNASLFNLVGENQISQNEFQCFIR